MNSLKLSFIGNLSVWVKTWGYFVTLLISIRLHHFQEMRSVCFKLRKQGLGLTVKFIQTDEKLPCMTGFSPLERACKMWKLRFPRKQHFSVSHKNQKSASKQPALGDDRFCAKIKLFQNCHNKSTAVSISLSHEPSPPTVCIYSVCGILNIE